MDTHTIPEAQIASLLRSVDDVPCFPGLDRISERLARGLRDVIGGKIMIEPQPAILKTYAVWRTEQGVSGAICRYNLHPVKGAMLLTFPHVLIARMVDIFFGGAGEVGCARSDFTSTERRFLSRIADQCLPILNAAWGDVMEINAQLIDIETDVTSTVFVKDSDPVIITPFILHGAGMTQTYISCVYPVAALRPIGALSQLSHDVSDRVIDPVWRGKMADAVMQARLPMRTIFARPELPVSQLLSLKPGDFIPICLPAHLPITIAGRLFAHGSVGDANGRSAIRIEKIEEGNVQHE
jgi:flagellar motor switch protein FliM